MQIGVLISDLLYKNEGKPVNKHNFVKSLLKILSTLGSARSRSPRTRLRVLRSFRKPSAYL